MAQKRKPEADRFWPKVNKNGKLILKTRCWEWTGSQNGVGYGQFRYGAEGKRGYAHRFSYELHKGPIPGGVDLLHHCDNPPCVNPNHLEAGGDSGNRKDSRNKDRLASAKLLVEEVRVIKAMIKKGESNELLGLIFGVHPTTVNNIRRGKTWAEIN